MDEHKNDMRQKPVTQSEVLLSLAKSLLEVEERLAKGLWFDRNGQPMMTYPGMEHSFDPGYKAHYAGAREAGATHEVAHQRALAYMARMKEPSKDGGSSPEAGPVR
jgi:hypothetical protein